MYMYTDALADIFVLYTLVMFSRRNDSALDPLLVLCLAYNIVTT